MRTSRGLHVVIGAMGVALLLMAWQYTQVAREVQTNQETIRQLAASVEATRQDAQELQRLVQALQQQVRDCRVHPRRCGPPLTEPPGEQTRPGTTPQPTGSAASASPSPSPTSSPRPTRPPSPRPTPSHTPNPTPSPSFCPIQRVCLPPVHP